MLGISIFGIIDTILRFHQVIRVVFEDTSACCSHGNSPGNQRGGGGSVRHERCGDLQKVVEGRAPPPGDVRQEERMRKAQIKTEPV